MKAVGTLNWDKIRDWLAEAGSACSGYYFDYAGKPTARVSQLPRRRFDQPRRPEKAEPTTQRVVGNRQF